MRASGCARKGTYIMDVADVAAAGRVGRGHRPHPAVFAPGSGPPAGRFALILLVLLGLYATYYQVNADEVAWSSGSAADVRTTDPGPHLKFPLIETVTRVPCPASIEDRVRIPHQDLGRAAPSSSRTPRRRPRRSC